MKIKIPEEQFYNSVLLLQPGRPILCTTKNEDGSDHVAPFSWVNPVSSKPPMVALALLNSPKKQHSLKNIERTGEFVINMPDIAIADSLIMSSYKTKLGENKFERSGFTRLPSVKVEPPSIMECRGHLECKVSSTLVTGDHTLIIANIIYAQYDEEAFSPSLLINLDKYKPALHLQNFNLSSSQIHIFMASGGAQFTEVAFPKKEEP